ncbi:MAG: glycosyltransferase family 9 protein, partial [Pirellula sp.]
FDADRLFASQSLSELGIQGPFCIINVGAGWPSKIWPSQRYADVANHLGKTHGLPSVVVWSGEKERLAAVEIAGKSSSYSKLAPATTLTQLRSLIRQSRLFVGSDTGPMHLAAALGVPTIGMIGPMPLQRVSPYGEQNIGVQRDSLPAHLTSQRKTNCAPMLSIHVEDVTAACDTILNRSYQLETNVACDPAAGILLCSQSNDWCKVPKNAFYLAPHLKRSSNACYRPSYSRKTSPWRTLFPRH